MRVGLAPLFQNYADINGFEAMMHGERRAQPDDSRTLQENFAICDLAEPLGFDSIWTYEHRASPYMLAPNPQQLISYYAGKTSRIDFGSMVTVVPWHHPVRLAENISLMQHMLGPKRKFRMGIGRGLARREYGSLGIDMNMSRELLAEGLEIVRRAFGEERFEFRGDVYNLEDTVVRPRPLDMDFLNDIYGVWTSDESMRVAAQLGLEPMTVPSRSLDSYRSDLAKYDDLRAQYGHGPSKPPILQVFMYCGESSAEAKGKAVQFANDYADSVVRHYELGGSHFEKIKGYGSYTADGATIYSEANEDMRISAKRNVSKIIANEGLFGTPKECIEKLEMIRELLDPSEIALACSFGRMTGAEALGSVNLFAERVLPTARMMSPAIKKAV